MLENGIPHISTSCVRARECLFEHLVAPWRHARCAQNLKRPASANGEGPVGRRSANVILRNVNIELPCLWSHVKKVPHAASLARCRMILVTSSLVLRRCREHGMAALHATERDVVAVGIGKNLQPVRIHCQEASDLHGFVLNGAVACARTSTARCARGRESCGRSGKFPRFVSDGRWSCGPMPGFIREVRRRLGWLFARLLQRWAGRHREIEYGWQRALPGTRRARMLQ